MIVAPRRRTATPRQTASEALTGHLRAQILDGAIAPGTPLREAALAAQHGLSRHTVRAALARLTAERLLVVKPFCGAAVADLGDQELIALQQLRAALEVEAVRLLHEQHGSAWPIEVTSPLAAAVTLLATQDRVGADWPALARAHSGVHLALVAAAGSTRITEAYRQLDAEILLLLLHLRPHYPPGAFAAEHLDYWQQVRIRGEQVVRAHLTHSTEVIRSSRAPARAGGAGDARVSTRGR